MFNFQYYIKSIRESKNLERDTVAHATNLSIETIMLIEEADSNSLLQTSSTLLKNQIRRYCEYLEIKEKKIISILNKLDILYYKKSRYGKLKFFDYLNRFVMLILIVAIAFLGYQHIEKNILSTSSGTTNSKSSIIYTPVDYDVESSDTDDKDQKLNDKTSNTSTDQNSKVKSKSTKKTMAHPPTTANMNDIVIDDPNSKSIDLSS